ncbi:glutathione synthetase [Lecanosticta acicola]|uniref:Glutathione synthetase n=1 Tax=Lecanosticta acicola TaxID=111012 RepID=A0AAI8Z9D0_9PEZI|nr:glutathione synthetase [Lecanosticta acicola]
MDLSEDGIQHLVSEIKDHQLIHGSLLKLVKYEELSTVPARPVGVSMVSTPFPHRSFQEAFSLQPIFNELYLRAAGNEVWLYSVLGPLLKHDAFFASLWDVFTAVKRAGVVQQVCCGIFRSDYMDHHGPTYKGIKQVEMNTFSVAGAAHADRVIKMHHHLDRIGAPGHSRYSNSERLPNRTSNVQAIVECLTEAHRLHDAENPAKSCVLMVVQPRNFNIADERPIEYGLWDENVPCFRCEWQAVLESTILTEERILFFDSPHRRRMEVSVIYYRAGYEAEEYDELGKQTRLRLELSKAIKCPDVLTHLTTFKTVQQALCSQDAVRRFLPAEQAVQIARTFMEMHVLDNTAEGERVRQWIVDPEHAQNYVLKPNLEGGGHNVFGEDIPDFLSTIPKGEWNRYTVMRMIRQPDSEGLLMMPADLYQGPVVSELGILGTCIWKRKGDEVEVLRNAAAGFTFKTKPSEVQEMSVVKGYGCFDCPLLYDP